jgi:hypothetical protein
VRARQIKSGFIARRSGNCTSGTFAVQAKLDRAYEEQLAGQITQEMWSRKSHEWEAELEAIRLQTGRHEKASRDYTVTGSRILELAKQAHSLFVRQSSEEQARLLKTLLSNCTFDRGSLSATYSKPFDMLVEGNVSGDWLGGRDSRARVSFVCGFSRLVAKRRAL